MSARIFYLPVSWPRALTGSVDLRLDAATEWLLSELDAPASIESLRVLAEKELAHPRDGIHRTWAQVFLDETKEMSRG